MHVSARCVGMLWAYKIPIVFRLCVPTTSSSLEVPASVTPSEVQIPSIQNVLLKQRYRLRKKVGSGGYGDVYKAIDSQFDRLVAIKEMSQDGLSPQEISEASEAFKREAFMLAALTHPGLPSIYDYFTENGSLVSGDEFY